jgi:hypothetical protein
MQIAAGIRRLVVYAAVPIATGAATWVNPSPVTQPPATQPPATQPPATQPQVSALPKAGTPGSQPQIGLSRQTGDNAAAGSGITVARWGFSPTVPGQPVYLSMTLDGTQAAIERMRADHPPSIQVHWVRESESGAPNLVTDLTIGQPGLAAALAGEIRRKGYFEWHSWARKDTLSPGTWTVSLTYPDGTPLLCGQDAQPCRFTINIG